MVTALKKRPAPMDHLAELEAAAGRFNHDR